MLSLVGMVVCLSLVVITGFVGQVSLAQVTLAGVSGFVVSHLFVHAGIGFPWGPLAGSVAGVVVGLIVGVSALRVRGASLAVVTLAGVIAIEQFGFANSRWGAGPSGSPVGQPKLFGFDDRRQRGVPRARRQAPEPCARLRLPRRRGRAVPARRQPASQRARPADAGGARQRAGGRGGRHQRRPGQDHGLRDLVVHRRHGRMDVRIQLRLGQRRPVRHPDRARVRRLRLHRRDHDGLGRRDRWAGRNRGPRPPLLPGDPRHLRQLDAAGRWPDPDRHPDPEPRGRGRHDVPQAAGRRSVPTAAAAAERRRPAVARGELRRDGDGRANHEHACCRPAASPSRSAACTPSSTSTSTSSPASWSA